MSQIEQSDHRSSDTSVKDQAVPPGEAFDPPVKSAFQLGFSTRVNPVIMKGLRSRLRWNKAISWGLMSLLLTIFAYIMVLTLQTKRVNVPMDVAAERATIWVFGIQAFMMMFMGTGSVAHGIASERDKLLLDFQRVTPLSTTSKILGYLFGLPIREYFIFLVSMPVIVFGVYQSGINPLTMLHLYLVFFSSVIMYHLIGMAIGMVAPRPRLVATGLQASIGGIYLAVLMQELAGFEIFRYLTMTPAVSYILVDVNIIPQNPLSKQAAFFKVTDLHPTVYTLIIQCLISVTCLTVVYRKWRDQYMHAIGKLYSFFFLLIFQVLMIGSIWPQLFAHLAQRDPRIPLSQIQQEDIQVTMIRIIIYLLISLPLGTALIFMTTPDKHGYLHGLRRARKFGKKQLPFHVDGADSWLTSMANIGLIAVTFMGFITLISMVPQSQLFIPKADVYMALTSIGIVVLALISIYACCSLFGHTSVVLYIFMTWLSPMMILGVMSMWTDSSVFNTGLYIGAFSPVISMSVAALGIFMTEEATALPRIMPEMVLPVSMLGLIWQFLMATMLMVIKFVQYHRTHTKVFSTELKKPVLQAQAERLNHD